MSMFLLQIGHFLNLFMQNSQNKCLHGKAIIFLLNSKQIGQIVPSSPYPSESFSRFFLYSSLYSFSYLFFVILDLYFL